MPRRSRNSGGELTRDLADTQAHATPFTAADEDFRAFDHRVRVATRRCDRVMIKAKRPFIRKAL